MQRKLYFHFIILIALLSFNTSYAQGGAVGDSTIKKTEYGGGFGIFPLPNKTMLSYRSNLTKRWAFDSKYGYTFTAVPQFNIELNMMHRHVRNEILNFYSGFGVTLDGFTPGIIVPIGFELMPLEKHPNLVFVMEASPKLTFSFSSAFYSTLNGNLGFIYFRPLKNKK
jgi:hypothetical protein